MDEEMILVKRITGFDARFIDELAAIEAKAFGDGGLNRWTFPVFIRYGAVYVIMCDDKIYGVADVIRDWVDRELAFVVGFLIIEGQRGKGFGLEFLARMIEMLADDGIKRVQLTVDPENRSAANLYDKLGFKAIAELPDEYGPAVDRVLYQLELEESDYGRRR